MAWDPDRYHQFQTERSAPFGDLLSLISVRPGLKVMDLGCGTGELTGRLADLLPDSDVLGIDNSAEMLARSEAVARPGLRFENKPIERVRGEWDLLLSNAALQWVPDHHILLPRLFFMLRPGGQLVVQVPSNFDHPAHALIRELAEESPFAEALAGMVRVWGTLPIEDYAQILFDCGASNITVFEKVYPHVLKNADAIADWVSGTALVPYMSVLHLQLGQLFMARYRAALRRRLPAAPVFYGFKRILFAAQRPEEPESLAT